MTNILGINLSELAIADLLKKITNLLEDSQQHYLVTPNPEIVLAAQKDEELFYILNKADLAIADGFGLKIVAFFFGLNLPRITGADLSVELLKLATQKGLKTIILNWENGLSTPEELELALTKKFVGLNFIVLNISRSKLLSPELINKINTFSPVLMFNTLGFPYQEKLIYHNLKKLPSIKLALGVGGAFDFISGKAHRAPKIMRHLGLEWLWRLIKEPKRFKRIYRATIIFISKILQARFIDHFRYRPNVICILYKNNNQQKKILILKREDASNHWQLPQGGRDGEDIISSGQRELQEETGVKPKNLITKGIFKNIYHYSFDYDSGRKIYQTTDRKTKRHSGYKGQKQSLYIAEFIGDDQEIKINFWDHIAWKWVIVDKLIEEVHPVRQSGAKIFLNKFKSLNL